MVSSGSGNGYKMSLIGLGGIGLRRLELPTPERAGSPPTAHYPGEEGNPGSVGATPTECERGEGE